MLHTTQKDAQGAQTKGEKVFSFLEETNLYWTVRKGKLFGGEGEETGSFGIFRNDTNKWLGTVGERYEPYQNYALVESIMEAADRVELKATRGGELNGGKQVYVQLELPDVYIAKSDMNRQLTALNSHNGSSSIGFGTTNTVVVCQNTFFRAMKDTKKVRHTMTAQQRIDAIVAEMRASLQIDEQNIETYQNLAKTEVNDEIIARLMAKIFKIEKYESKEQLSTRKENQMKQMISSIYTEFKLEGENLWGLFNGVTRYTNHVLKPELSDLYFGTSADINELALNEIIAYRETVLV